MGSKGLTTLEMILQILQGYHGQWNSDNHWFVNVNEGHISYEYVCCDDELCYNNDYEKFNLITDLIDYLMKYNKDFEWFKVR